MKDISAGLMSVILLLTCALIYEFFVDRNRFYAFICTIFIGVGLISLFFFIFKWLGFA